MKQQPNEAKESARALNRDGLRLKSFTMGHDSDGNSVMFGLGEDGKVYERKGKQFAFPDNTDQKRDGINRYTKWLTWWQPVPMGLDPEPDYEDPARPVQYFK